MSTVIPDLATIDVASPSIYATRIPHTEMALLREHSPVHWHPYPGRKGGFWLLAKHADVVAVGKDPKTFSSHVGHIVLEDRTAEQMAVRTSILEMDPPEHTRLRRFVSSAFTPRRVREYTDYTRKVVSEALDAATADAEFDWVKAVSEPIPVNVLIAILDLPRDDTPWLLEAVTEMAMSTDLDYEPDFERWPSDIPRHLLPFDSPASLHVFEYGRKLGAMRRASPGDDLVTRLVMAEVNGERLNDYEYCNFFQVFIFAGNETTRTGISAAVLALAQNPDQYERILADPTLAERATEEILRFATPVTYFRRTATRDTEIRGVSIERGDRVAMWYLSANYDDEVFDDPYRLDLGRWPNPHISFGGGGPHFCLGAFLARLEIQVLLEEMARRQLRVELAGEPVRIRSNFVNGYKSIPVRVLTGAR